MADTSIKLSGTYDSIEAYRILEEMRELNTDTEGYKTDAEAAAVTATSAATTAQGHANDASTYATNASTYADNANTSATAAAGSASTASTAAGNALNSETAAAGSASAASTSETNAAASATAAAASAAEAAATLRTIVPAGVVLAYAGSTTPTGWLLCDGSAVSRTTYAALFAVIGTTYGEGNGSTTFNLPNLVNRMAVGAGSSYALAATGGEATHKLTVAELAQHNHTFTGSAVNTGNNSVGHTHSRGTMDITGSVSIWHWHVQGASGAFTQVSAQGNVPWYSGTDKGSSGVNFKASNAWTGSTSGISANHTHSVTAEGTIGNKGSNTAHNNMPPYLALRYIIKY